MSYSPVLAMGVWLGNSDTRTLTNGNSTLPGPMISTVMGYAHSLYKDEGKYTTDQWFTRPSGIQTIGGELYPSWYSKDKSRTNAKLTFDRVSKKKATKCTPDAARIEIDVVKSLDPVSKKPIYIAPDGYDATKDDDKHACGDKEPTVRVSVTGNKISVTVTRGKFSLDRLSITVDGKSIRDSSISSSDTYETNYTFAKKSKIAVNVTDKGYYETTVTTDGGSDPSKTP